MAKGKPTGGSKKKKGQKHLPDAPDPNKPKQQQSFGGGGSKQGWGQGDTEEVWITHART